MILSIDDELIERAKHYSKKRGKTLSQTVEDYFALMGHPVEMNEEDLPPDLRSLIGMLEGYDKKGYKEYRAEYIERIEEKYR